MRKNHHSRQPLHNIHQGICNPLMHHLFWEFISRQKLDPSLVDGKATNLVRCHNRVEPHPSKIVEQELHPTCTLTCSHGTQNCLSRSGPFLSTTTNLSLVSAFTTPLSTARSEQPTRPTPYTTPTNSLSFPLIPSPPYGLGGYLLERGTRGHLENID